VDSGHVQAGSVSLQFGFRRGRYRQERNPVDLSRFETAKLDFSLWNFDNVFAVSFFSRDGIQPAKVIRYFNE